MFLSVHSALTNENVLKKSNVILVQGGIRFNFVEYNRKSQTINRWLYGTLQRNFESVFLMINHNFLRNFFSSIELQNTVICVFTIFHSFPLGVGRVSGVCRPTRWSMRQQDRIRDLIKKYIHIYILLLFCFKFHTTSTIRNLDLNSTSIYISCYSSSCQTNTIFLLKSE